MKKLVLMLMLFAPMMAMAQTPKFGHVNAQEVMQSLPGFSRVRGELEAQAKQADNEMKQMQDEIQKMSDEYNANKSTMNETKRQETEDKIQQAIQKYQQASQDNQEKINKAQQEKLQPIYTKVMTAIKNVGKAGGYVYIMDVSSGIPYISDTLSKDVTSEVKTEVNKIANAAAPKK